MYAFVMSTMSYNIYEYLRGVWSWCGFHLYYFRSHMRLSVNSLFFTQIFRK